MHQSKGNGRLKLYLLNTDSTSFDSFYKWKILIDQQHFVTRASH